MPKRTALLVLATVVVALPVYVSPFMFFPDDALFYPQVASNIVTQHWSTFNGITSTNGYHPLWMVLNVTAALLAGGAKTRALYITISFQMCLLLSIIAAYQNFSRRASINSGLGGP